MKVEFTNEQVNTLVYYILMTTQHREREREAWEELEREREAWEELSKEMNEDGTPKFKNAKSNAEYYADLEFKLKEIRNVLNDAR